jgi:hypothetical protein
MCRRLRCSKRHCKHMQHLVLSETLHVLFLRLRLRRLLLIPVSDVLADSGRIMMIAQRASVGRTWCVPTS